MTTTTTASSVNTLAKKPVVRSAPHNPVSPATALAEQVRRASLSDNKHSAAADGDMQDTQPGASQPTNGVAIPAAAPPAAALPAAVPAAPDVTARLAELEARFLAAEKRADDEKKRADEEKKRADDAKERADGAERKAACEPNREPLPAAGRAHANIADTLKTIIDTAPTDILRAEDHGEDKTEYVMPDWNSWTIGDNVKNIRSGVKSQMRLTGEAEARTFADKVTKGLKYFIQARACHVKAARAMYIDRVRNESILLNADRLAVQQQGKMQDLTAKAQAKLDNLTRR